VSERPSISKNNLDTYRYYPLFIFTPKTGIELPETDEFVFTVRFPLFIKAEKSERNCGEKGTQPNLTVTQEDVTHFSVFAKVEQRRKMRS